MSRLKSEDSGDSPRPRAKPAKTPHNVERARALAFQVLSAVMDSRQGILQPVTEALSEALRRSRLPRRDESFATELVYSTVRRRLTLDWLIRKFSGVDIRRIDPPLLNVLRLGVLQLLYIDSVPSYAAVDESVRLARGFLGKKAAGFANSVLRKIASAAIIPWPPREKNVVEHLSVLHSHPRWLIRRWVEHLGEEAAESICLADNSPPPLTARVNVLKTTTQALIQRMKEEGAEVIPAALEGTLEIVRSAKRVVNLDSFREGLFYIQDVSATIPARMLDPAPGERILDLCCAPGGKATQIAEQMGNRGLVVACDSGETKMPKLQENIRRLGTTIVSPLVADGTTIHTTLTVPFDRVLIDAPCSNTGVLRRRVEARWRLREDDLKGLHVVQMNLLRSASRLLKPGGVLIYSTCSIDPEENERVIAQFLSDERKIALVEEKMTLQEVGGGDGGYVAKLCKQ